MEIYEFASYRETTHYVRVVDAFFPIGITQHITQPPADNTIVDESDGVHGRVRAAASLCFVLAAQARKLSLSGSLGWAEEAQKRHARDSDGDAAIIEVMNYALCFRSLCLVAVALGRSSWWKNWACDPHDFF